MSFEHPLVLAGAPLALAWLFLAFRARRSARAIGARIEQRFAGARRLSTRPPRRARLRGGLAALGALLALSALAGPQWGTVTETSVERSREVLIALDLSRSMLAADVSPSRLDRSKLLVRSLLDELPGEQVGLVLFAGTAFLQSPLSADHEVLRELLADLGPQSLPQGGTDYGAMLRASIEAFRPGGEGDRFLVVLSDGEAHDEGWRELLPAVGKAGIRVIALGVGTPEGAVIPERRGGIVKDERGAAVLTRLESGTLAALAQETGGTYRDAASWVDVAPLIDATVAQGTAGRYVEERGVRPQERFQWLLAPALACWLLAFWRELPVRPVRRRLAAAGTALAAALWLAASPHSALAASPPSTAASATAPGALEATVAELAAKPALAPPDYAHLAEQTLAYGEQPASAASSALAGVVEDALLGVDRGEREDPKAADWPGLRQRLIALKERQERERQQEPPQGQQQEEQQGQGQQQEEQQPEQQEQGQQQGDQTPNPEQSGSRVQNPSAGQGATGNQERDAERSEDAGDRQQESEPQHGGAGSRSPGAASEPDANPGDRARAEHGASPAPDPGPGAGRESSVSADAQDDSAGAEPKPVAEPEAGLGALDQGADPSAANRDEQAAASPPQEAQTRRVGGGGGIESKPASEPGLVEALGRQARVRDGDSPSVLFQRMQRAEGRERPQSKGKNW